MPYPSPQPDPNTIDFVVLIIVIGSIAIGLISMFIGKVVEWWDAVRAAIKARRVNTSTPVMSPTPAQTTPDQQTDEADRRASAGLSGDPRHCPALRLDRTKAGLITLLVYNEWTVSEIRAVLKGDNNVLGPEIEAARVRLGLPPAGEYRTPIAGRPTSAVFETGDLAYEPPPTK